MRRIAVGLVAAAALAAAGWSALWGYAAHEAGRRADAFIADEAAAGRDWSCPDRRIGGYPFALTLRCAGPTYASQSGGQHVAGTLGSLEARVGLADPRRVTLTLGGPFTFKTSDGATSVEGRWQGLAVALRPLPDVGRFELRGSDVAVAGLFNGTEAAGRAASLSIEATLQPGDDPVLAFAATLGGATLPPLDALLGGTAPVDADIGGRLHQAAVGEVQTPEQAMERWRLAGGRVDIDHLAMTRAGAKMTASGSLRLDDRHRLKGRLDAEFLGLGPILKSYGIGADLAAVGSIVGALFGGGAPRKPPTPGALALPIVLGNGRVGIGPVTTGIELTPLY